MTTIGNGTGFSFVSYGAAMSREQQLEMEVKTLRERIATLDDEPVVYAVVVGESEDKKRAHVCSGPQLMSLRKPAAMQGLEKGAVIRLRAGQKPTILEVVKDPPQTGPIVTVKRRLGPDTIELEPSPGMAQRAVIDTHDCRPGDGALLDLTGAAVVRNLGSGDDSRQFTGETGVSWDDIGGQEEAKRALIEAIEEPSRHKAIYAKYRQRATRGILLYGPPGTGKSLLGKAAATSLAATHGAKAKLTGFQYVKAAELLNKFVGQSESNIRAVFASARAHKAREGYPAIVFIDEADAIMGVRGRTGGIEGMERTVVPQFLAEMDGLEDAGALVLLATNRPDTLDPAITRDGRVDRKVFVRRPNREEVKAIFRIHLKDKPAHYETDDTDLAEFAAREFFEPAHALYIVRTKSGKDKRLTLGDMASGSLVEGIVRRATQGAIRREVKNPKQKSHGLVTHDLKDAVQESVAELHGLDHGAFIQECTEDLAGDVVRVDRAASRSAQ